MTQVIELIDKDSQTIMMVFHIFKKLEERVYMLSRVIEDIKRRLRLKFYMKIIMPQSTSTPDGVTSRINIAEDINGRLMDLKIQKRERERREER